jgi:hypothetical protein
MSGINVWESHFFESGTESATSGDDTRSLEYFVTGTDSYAVARAAFESYFSLNHDGLQLQKYRLKQLGTQLWKVTTNYGNSITQSQSFRVDTTGATLRLTHGFSETRYGPGGDNSTVPPQDAALNVQDGRIEGHEKIIPSMSLTLRDKYPRDWITDAYLDSVENLTGTINAAPFGGRGAETLLFLGATINQPASGDAECEFKFLSGRHIQNLTLGSVTGINKKAHQFLWPLWDTVDDTGANRNRKQIAGVYVNDVAQVVSWAGLLPVDPGP